MEKQHQIKDIFDEGFTAQRQHRTAKTNPLHKYIHKELIERLGDLKEKPTPFTDYQPISPTLTDSLIKKDYEQGEAPYGLITSILQLQSINNLTVTLQAFHASLKPEGLFMGVMLGGNTLHELRTCLIEAEATLSNGTRPRVIPMMNQETASNHLLQAGFAHPVLDHECVTLTYPDIWELMKALRAMSLANNLKARPRHFTRRKLFERANELYKARYPTKQGGINATFDLFFLHGWKEKD